jgi:hypothetical protein
LLSSGVKIPAEVFLYFSHPHNTSLRLVCQTTTTPFKVNSRLAKLNRRLYRSAARHQIDDEHNQGDNKQQVNDVANMQHRKPKQPKNQQYHKNCPQHGAFSFIPYINLLSLWNEVFRSNDHAT